jgi:hypothetical protein
VKCQVQLKSKHPVKISSKRKRESDDLPKKSEAEKKRRLKTFLEFLEEKASSKTVRFVIDVDKWEASTICVLFSRGLMFISAFT